MTSLLSKANEALSQQKDLVNPRWYPRYHLAPPTGWMNDPNGLSWFDGYYHAFYQHYPWQPVWGPMHWGHARSRDMVNWEHLPIALAPEGPEDKNGCFSGSAVVEGNKLALIYTGHKFDGEAKEENLYQVQCLATSTDGIHFERQGMILDTPRGVHHFRDPKVWQEGDNWYMVVGARVDDVGEVQLYRSQDLQHWQFASTLGGADDGMGYMWECPDLFPLNDKLVFMFSPQGIAADGYDCRNLFQSGYMVGEWQDNLHFHVTHAFQEMDHGHDFYAPQSFTTPDGRRIVIGWLSMWESPMPEQADGWAGMLTLPREVTLDTDQRLRMNPVKELELLRGELHVWPVSELHNRTLMVEGQAHAMEVELSLDIARSSAEEYGIALGDGLRVYVDAQAQRLVLDRRYPQHSLSGYRSVPLPVGDRLDLRLFIDSSSVEVFVNHGEYTFSSRIYPEPDDRQLTLFSLNGHAIFNQGHAWPLSAK
ncbi:glycoside hydrolase family 32 protein [Citrobacter portucalensis]|uniref:glycoside hydrolase family 32 protein n=1 Tax=Citrobacter portucalensis TaxID=1639133 RepID=UPI0022433B98|nr:glycoside hydrolase family 32 protein [Citrobacter portucalensis]MCW8353986.1 glycoside hydrolase family 32 protein [Citrobacter portucalensis]MCX9053330.1 glycoside hydrolase family 32 protein [Citrobacter portucalensis]